MASREKFGSSAATVMAMAGSAIGLGNIWRFPYITGQNGGAAFIVLYLVCVLILSLPILLCESVIGRRAGANTFGAMGKLAPGTGWKWLGVLTVFTPLIILSFYSVVGGWAMDFLTEAAARGFDENSTGSTGVFATLTSSVWKPLAYHTAFLALTALIVMAGVKSGIEAFNKISLPLLFVFILFTAVYSLTLPGSSEGVRYLLYPDFSKIGVRSVADAMGQGFFSLSLGVGTILTYSSYMKKSDSIIGNGMGTVLADLAFAILAGFAILPAVFAAGIEPGSGPGLLFESLPYVFSKMGAGLPVLSRIISVVFFLTIVVAALTSSISMFEVGVAYLVEERRMSRRKAVAILFAGTWVLGALCSVDGGIFGFCDKLTSNVLMTFGGLLFVLFVGWRMKKEEVRDELTNGGKLRGASVCFDVVYFLIRYVAPAGILIIFLTNLFQDL